MQLTPYQTELNGCQVAIRNHFKKLTTSSWPMRLIFVALLCLKYSSSEINPINLKFDRPILETLMMKGCLCKTYDYYYYYDSWY